jgi:hypothetical protein
LLFADATEAADATWAATAAWIGLLDAVAPLATDKAASLLQVKAQVVPAAPKRNCLLFTNDVIMLKTLSSYLQIPALQLYSPALITTRY